MESPHSLRGPSPEASGEASQHSAGPWHIGPGDYGIVEVRGPDGWIVPLGYKPNARLIAAAPELLAVLRDLVEHPYDGEGRNLAVLARARAAIAKAVQP